ncbi:MAG: translation initiation factor IF-2 [Chloroflexota bacterium]
MGPRSAAAVVPQHAPVQLPSQMTVKELADLMGDTAVNVIKELMTKHGVMANINQLLDRNTAESLVKGMGYEVAEAPEVAVNGDIAGPDSLTMERLAAKTEASDQLAPRPPVITVMGHVDHGKTTLLDAIRQANVAGGEAGGITQHIGAYQVDHNGEKLTFLDTPGHEAFTAMRARGAQVTDVAVIVVAADDGVQPQTIEAINHARAAKVPMVVAINKVDAAGANVDRIKQQLSDNGVLVEDWGGDVPAEAVSARQKTGIDDLLDLILLVAQLQDLQADSQRAAQGTIIEAKLDKQVGPVATVLVQNGTLKVSDVIVAGAVSGRIRTMLNDRGKPVRRADPSTPVAIHGLSGLPNAGDTFSVVPDERMARTIAEEVAATRQAAAGQGGSTVGRISLDTATQETATSQNKEFNVVIKTDVQGTLEAIRQSVVGLANAEVAVNVIHGGVGNISESDILLGLASKALVVGFNVKVDTGARRAADQNSVEIRLYEVIYGLLDDLEKAVNGMLEPVYEERITGHADVRQIFKLPRNEVVAGCFVTDGLVTKTSQIRLLRRGTKEFEGKLSSLRRFKDSVNEVAQGFECGIGLEGWRDIQIGDVLEFFGQERVR